MKRIVKDWIYPVMIVVAAFIASSLLNTVGAEPAAKEWSAPRGLHRVTVEPHTLIESYTDIPPGLRRVLAYKVRNHLYDDVVDILANDIVSVKEKSGPVNSYTNLRDMHFGAGSRVAILTRNTWTKDDEERALVYCARDSKVEHCVIVPIVCGNVSRIDKVKREDPPKPPAPPTPPTPPGGPGLDIPPVIGGQPAVDGGTSFGMGVGFVDPTNPPPPVPSLDADYKQPDPDQPWPWADRPFIGPIFGHITGAILGPECEHKCRVCVPDGPPGRPGKPGEPSHPPGGWNPSGGVPVAPVPELSTFGYMLIAMGLIALARRNKRKASDPVSMAGLWYQRGRTMHAANKSIPITD